MPINLDNGCTCSHHQFLNFMKEEANDKATSLLQKLKNPCDAIKKSKTTLLHHAAQSKNTTMVQPLIDHGFKVNAQDASGNTPLFLAIQEANVSAVDILLKNNADLYGSNSSGENSLQTASLKCYPYGSNDLLEKAEFTIWKKLFEKVDKDFLEDKNTTTQLVLKAKNPVKLVIVANANVELAKIVLKNDYPLNLRESDYGYTALHVAIKFQNIDNILLLTEHGADVDVHDGSQYSAVHFYLYYCQDVDNTLIALNSLLSRTKGLHFPNKRRESDLEHFLMFGNEKAARAALQKTLQLGVDVSAMKFHGGKSILHILVENGEIDNAVHLLEELGIQYEMKALDANKCTALTLALRCGRAETVDSLLKRGAKITMTKRDSLVLIEISELLNITSGKVNLDHMPKIIEVLLEHGVDAQCVFGKKGSLIKRLCNRRPQKDLNIGDKMIVAHLALLATIKDSALTDLTRKDINSDPFFKAYFALCMKQLEEMKKIKVHGNVMLLNLLTKNEEQITVYARNQEFISEFHSVMQKNSHLEKYYSIVLNRRVTKAIDASKLQLKVAGIIEKLTGICSDVYRVIMYEIINYLSPQDKRNLCKVEGLLSAKK